MEVGWLLLLFISYATLDWLSIVSSSARALSFAVASFHVDARTGFDLQRYESHVLANTGECPLSLREILPLTEDLRTDLIWRFIAVIFLAHAGIIEVWQQGPEIRVKKRETYGKGQGILGELEEPDGIEGPMGGTEGG